MSVAAAGEERGFAVLRDGVWMPVGRIGARGDGGERRSPRRAADRVVLPEAAVDGVGWDVRGVEAAAEGEAGALICSELAATGPGASGAS